MISDTWIFQSHRRLYIIQEISCSFYNYQQYYIVFYIIIAKISHKTVGITLKKISTVLDKMFKKSLRSLKGINIRQFLIHRFKRKDYFLERKENHR